MEVVQCLRRHRHAEPGIASGEDGAAFPALAYGPGPASWFCFVTHVPRLPGFLFMWLLVLELPLLTLRGHTLANALPSPMIFQFSDSSSPSSSSPSPNSNPYSLACATAKPSPTASSSFAQAYASALVSSASAGSPWNKLVGDQASLITPALVRRRARPRPFGGPWIPENSLVRFLLFPNPTTPSPADMFLPHHRQSSDRIDIRDTVCSSRCALGP